MTEASPPSVLVADDEDSIRVLVTRMLHRAGFAVIEASDGQDAIELLNVRDFDAIVLDLMMPRVDGFGVVEHLIEIKPRMMEKTRDDGISQNSGQGASARTLLHCLEAVRHTGVHRDRSRLRCKVTRRRERPRPLRSLPALRDDFDEKRRGRPVHFWHPPRARPSLSAVTPMTRAAHVHFQRLPLASV